MRNRLIISWTAVTALIATALIVVALRPSTTDSSTTGPDTTPPPPVTASAAEVVATSTPPTPEPPVIVPDEEPPAEPDIPAPEEPPPPDQVDFEVDPGLVPSTDTVAGFGGAGEPRPVARLRSTGGTESDVVLHELVITTSDDSALQAFLDRWNGTVVDTTPSDDPGSADDPDTHLVRVDPTTADLDRLPADLLAVEPHHDGTFAASDPAALALMAIAAHEAAVYGTEVSLNWLAPSTGVREGSSAEDPGREGNSKEHERSDAFDWVWISSHSNQASGIDAAWQLIAGRGGVGNRIPILVADAGFFPNADFPLEATIRGSDWREPNQGNCTNDTPCPFHGTDVTLAAMGKVDNGFGSAGPAFQVGELVAYTRSGGFYGQFKDIRNVAEDHDVKVVNMSFGGDITAFQGAAESLYNRIFRKLRDDHNVLSFAAAGNDGVDVDSNDALTAPCELSAVVCVGGVQTDPLQRASGSNFGTGTGGGSVEIYGPMCFYGLANPDVPGDSTTKTTCGTSIASPVVAGVAAMVMAANPTLSAKQVWQVMKDTAHNDDLGGEITGHHRRIDAYRAVATAMGVFYEPPEITVHGPTDDVEVGPNDFVDLDASAKDFANLDLPVQWFTLDNEPVNANPTEGPVTVGELGPGRHTFIVRATDLLGGTSSASIEIDIENTPPSVSISSPAANTYRYTPEDVLLDGSTDDADDLWAALDDGAVVWRVRPQGGGDVLFEASGHSGVIPGGTLPAGDYEVQFIGTDSAGESRSDSALLTMLDVPPGESLPEPHITSPSHDEAFSTGSGSTATARLTGWASDAQDGPVPGTSMRWIAEQGDTRVVLCEGSDLSEGGGGFAVDADCSDVTVELGIPPESPKNMRWTITLEAIDSAGLPGRTSVAVEVAHHEG